MSDRRRVEIDYRRGRTIGQADAAIERMRGRHGNAHDEPGLVAFLRARLDEVEHWARQATVFDGPDWTCLSTGIVETQADAYVFNDRGTAYHVEHHDPGRVLREVEARRGILALHADQHECPGSPAAYEYPYVGCATLRLLALPDDQHPDYQEEWRP